MQASAKEIASIRMDATDSLEREVRVLRDTTQMAVDDAGRYILVLSYLSLPFSPLYDLVVVGCHTIQSLSLS